LFFLLLPVCDVHPLCASKYSRQACAHRTDGCGSNIFRANLERPCDAVRRKRYSLCRADGQCSRSSKFQRQEENFDEDNAGAGGRGDEEEAADLTSTRSTKEEKIEQLKEEAGLSKLQRLQKQARENKKKLMEEKLSKIEMIGNGNKPHPDDGIPVEEETLGNIGSADERQREEEVGMSKLQRLQKQARENRKKLMEEKLSKIEIGGDNNKSIGDGV
jgi:hypothetical protein